MSAPDASRSAGRLASPSGGERVRRGPFRTVWHVVARTAVKAWGDSIFGKAAGAAFWQTLSLPPLLLGLLGMLGYIGDLFGPDTLEIIRSKIVTFSGTVFSENVVGDIIGPTIDDMLARGRAGIVSMSFVLSLWAGSSAIATFVDAICEAHGQLDHRNPIWQRIFALLLYVAFLVLAAFTLPLVALGPALITQMLPESWRDTGAHLIDSFYYPAVFLLLLVGLTTLYKLALPRTLPWHRLLGGALLAGGFFLAASMVLRRYLAWVTSTGYTYGALATPIAFLLFTFFLGFAVVLGAEFNATIQETWPARATRIEQVRGWIATHAVDSEDASGPLTTLTWKLVTGPMALERTGAAYPSVPVEAGPTPPRAEGGRIDGDSTDGESTDRAHRADTEHDAESSENPEPRAGSQDTRPGSTSA
ncbi:YihY/virulence factor BrkB family protein [Rhodococcus rhodnii]|uniref:YihY/virulence factor BrkB family protein n=1 Tax=Rhodococcus rhodnii TaxID=38312 RepID=A0A6P2CK27_9NOCA|nr:YhjD/YihY/BrkB family envelope integrity protein [Rhodococcus rhodnii]TXG92662.1 YihY/virulence factor BrkB family protein [Rhodococcus rhodnii]